uniref:Uncharacterized protein n=1 Tax=Corethron hystrix TaxID=216773 RepID=A0A7S1BI09_9STRA|mmetsp:Transcript_29213/g.67013  ORF Transcript_29213/g.67013 Transcript_29213/m.67013 type:complete len:431 (+) Transcript_29213:419-1711(+)
MKHVPGLISSIFFLLTMAAGGTSDSDGPEGGAQNIRRVAGGETEDFLPLAEPYGISPPAPGGDGDRGGMLTAEQYALLHRRALRTHPGAPSDASYFMGLAHLYGLVPATRASRGQRDGGEEDGRRTAAWWFERAARSGHVEATFAMGLLMYRRGSEAAPYTTEPIRASAFRDLTASIRYFRSAESRRPDFGWGSFWLARALYERMAVGKEEMHSKYNGSNEMADVSSERILEISNRPKDQNSSRIENFNRNETLMEISKLFQTAAAKGVTDAFFYLGVFQEYGLSVPEMEDNDGPLPISSDSAASLYRKAAQNGNAAASYHLALMYLEGRGVDKNGALAAEFFRRAADAGHVPSLRYLALLSLEGTVTRWRDGIPDYGMALYWYSMCAESGNFIAQQCEKEKTIINDAIRSTSIDAVNVSQQKLGLNAST